MMPPRAQALFAALLGSAALFSLSSAAQSEPAPANPVEREIAISGAVGEPAAVVYGAPDVPVIVSFDAPLKKDGAVVAQGAEVRPHPFVPNALVIMPSKALAAQSSIPVVVPLADGEVALLLAFSPAKRDTSVRIVRRASSVQPAMTKPEQQELLSLAASKVLDTGACANTTAIPGRANRDKDGELPGYPLVCGGGAFTYMRVKAKADCAPATARMIRGEESTEVLLLQQSTQPCRVGTCWLVVARTPHGDGRGFALELIAPDGVPCMSIPVESR